MNTWSLFPPGNDLVDSLDKVEASLDPSKISMSFSTLVSQYRLSVGDVVFNLVSSNIKSLQCLPRSLFSPAPLAVLSLVYAATGTALSLALISTGLVEPRLLHVVTVVLNHRTFPISCWTALYSTICVGPYSATPSPF